MCRCQFGVRFLAFVASLALPNSGRLLLLSCEAVSLQFEVFALIDLSCIGSTCAIDGQRSGLCPSHPMPQTGPSRSDPSAKLSISLSTACSAGCVKIDPQPFFFLFSSLRGRTAFSGRFGGCCSNLMLRRDTTSALNYSAGHAAARFRMRPDCRLRKRSKDPIHFADPAIATFRISAIVFNQPKPSSKAPLPLAEVYPRCRVVRYQSHSHRSVPGSAPHAAPPPSSGTRPQNPRVSNPLSHHRHRLRSRDLSSITKPRRVPRFRWLEHFASTISPLRFSPKGSRL